MNFTSSPMNAQIDSQSHVPGSLSDEILNQLQTLIQAAEEEAKPLEIDPHRSRLFELFVTAEGAGLLDEDAEDNLTADTVCRSLAARWGLTYAAQQSVKEQKRLPPEHVARMRLLWSVMRMWMEWDYAWSRWSEFHRHARDD